MTSVDDVDQLHSGVARYGHILSEKSAELQRDTFFFAHMGGFPIRLVLGLNQQITPVTPATLQRWADLMVGRHHEFFLCPVTVNPKGIMSYSMTPTGPTILPDSDDPLPPGNYGWYRNPILGPSEFPELTGVHMAVRNRSFEHNVTFMGDKLWALYTFPADLERRVLARDTQRCRVTGHTIDIMSTWIVPPPWSWTVANSWDPPEIVPKLSDDGLHPLGMDCTPFLVAANAITLRKDLKLHFYNHNFTVDADDNYRVVILRDMGEARNLLPTHLPRHGAHDANDFMFFRLHLRYSMNFMLLGGDIQEKYPPHVILHEMDQLGVPGPCDCDDPDREMAPLDDPRWQTELGQAILADVIRIKAAASFNSYSDEELESESDEECEPKSDEANDASTAARASSQPFWWDLGWINEGEEAQAVPVSQKS
ncbi:hypothetical protein DFH08DRAFT_901213 [Mycena albidolilacea]|uniref:Uncharacterized protein n=1 Tax=Mycena albidolilacea TaxID=1033008 RepID=A0AAD6Z530_9AGAR|nr:hypothetical protein DFH08DRAFT_901213 [Mycena albidolilacea]